MSTKTNFRGSAATTEETLFALPQESISALFREK